MAEPVVAMVLGASRSGTTLLDLMIGGRSGAFSCGEVAFVFRPRRRHQRDWQCRCGRRPCPIWQKVGLSRPSGFHARVVDGLNVGLVSDSSKSLSWLIDAHKWNRRAGLRTADIVIWKDPVDLAYSYWRRSNDPTAWRAAFVSYYGRYLDLGLPFTPVRYRGLVEDPSGTIRSICSTIGAEYTIGQERVWESAEHHHAFGSEGPLRALSNGPATVARAEPESDFIDAWSKVSQELDDDEAVQRVIGALEARQEGADTQDLEPAPLHRPPWYFKDRAITLYRRFAPSQ